MTADLHHDYVVKSMQSKIKEIDSNEQSLKSKIEEADVEELELRREMTKLKRIQSLKYNITQIEDRKRILLSQIESLDDDQIKLVREAQTLRDRAIQKQTQTTHSNVPTMSLVGGGFLAAAGFRSALMNRKETQELLKTDEENTPLIQLHEIVKTNMEEFISRNITSFDFIHHMKTQVQTIMSGLSSDYRSDLEKFKVRNSINVFDIRKHVQLLMSSVETELFRPRERSRSYQLKSNAYNSSVRKGYNHDSQLIRNNVQQAKDVDAPIILKNSNSMQKTNTTAYDINDVSGKTATSHSSTTKIENRSDIVLDGHTKASKELLTDIVFKKDAYKKIAVQDPNLSVLSNYDSKTPILLELKDLEFKTTDELTSSSSFRAIGLGTCGQNAISNISSELFDVNNSLIALNFSYNEKADFLAAISATESRLTALVRNVKFCVIICEAADYYSAETAKLLTKQSRSLGILTFCVVSSPFHFEGAARLHRAKKTIELLQGLADTVIIVPSDTMLELIPRNSSIHDAYSMIDNVIGDIVTDILDRAAKRGLTNEMVDNSSTQPTEIRHQHKSQESETALPCSTEMKSIHSEMKDVQFRLTSKKVNETVAISEESPQNELQSKRLPGGMNNCRTFGIGDAGCSAIVKLHPSCFNASDIFGIHFDLNVLTPVKERGANDTFSIPVDNDLDDVSFKQKMIKAIYRSSNELSVLVDDAKLCVVTCEAADVFSSQAAITLVQKAKEKGALTICLVNLPFSFEGNKRLKRAEKTVGVLKEIADTVIVIPSDPIMELIPKDTSIENAYSMIDDVVSKGVAGIIGLVGKQGLINANFKDIETIQKGAGIGSMGLGSSSGKNAAKEAALAAVSNPLLGETIDSARSIVLSVSGGKNMSLSDVRSVVNVVYKCVDEATDVAVSAFVDENLDDQISVTLFAMGRESTSDHCCNTVGEALCMEHDSETQDQDATGISSIQNKNVSEQERSVPPITPANKLLPMTADEILSLDRQANYSTSIIHPYMSIESKLKLKGMDNTKLTSRAVANSLFGAKESPQEVKRRSLNHSKAVADSLFIPKTSNVRNSGLFSGGITQRTTKLNLLQFSILENSLSSSTSSTSNTHHVGLFGKPTTHHKNYVRFAIRKRTPLSHMNLLLQMLDKTIKQYLL